MNLIGKIVFHKLWGQGMIINQTKTRIIVEFVSHSIGEKVFIYPDIFRKLLKCVDNTTELYIQSLLHNKNFMVIRIYILNTIMLTVHHFQFQLLCNIVA